MDMREKAHKLNEDFKKHGIVNPVMAYLLGLSAIAPNRDILRAIEAGIAPIANCNKNFTSPFPKQTTSADGDLKFAVTENGYPVGMNLDEPHTLICGASKSGKTVCVEIISTEALKKGYKLWMFTRADDLTRIIRIYNDIFYEDFTGKLRLNPLFFLPKTIFTTIFKDAYVLYEGSESYILETLKELEIKNKYPSLYDLYYFLKAKKEPALSRIARFKESVQNRLEGMLNSPLGKIYDCVRGHEQDIVKTNAIFNIGSLTLPERKFFVNSIITLLYLYNTGESNVSISS